MFHLELKAGWREPFDQAKLLVIEACSFMVKVYSISVHWPCATSSFGLASTVVRLVSAISAKAKCAYGGILTKTLFRVIYSRRLPGLIFMREFDCSWAELFILWADERWYGLYRSVVGQSSYLLANWSGVVIEVKVNSINNASWLNYEDSTRIRLCR